METKNQEFFHRFNEAFARQDSAYIINQVTDDIVWNMVGESLIQGKKAFSKTIQEMNNDNSCEFKIHHTITHGKTAAVDGIMKVTDPSGNVKIYAFCDIYLMSGFKNAKIKEMTSYVLETKEEA